MDVGHYNRQSFFQGVRNHGVGERENVASFHMTILMAPNTNPPALSCDTRPIEPGGGEGLLLAVV